mmetsp:Transcript_44369/g.125281  ORF Transcript_44369/g.125281 Transcript_44369/m.125281 type:complete len:257 (-) Transcript_44369:7-777(-)
MADGVHLLTIAVHGGRTPVAAMSAPSPNLEIRVASASHVHRGDRQQAHPQHLEDGAGGRRVAVQQIFVVVHIANLARDRHADGVVRPSLGEAAERLVGRLAEPRVQQVRRDDEARAALARLAVDRDDIRRVLGEVGVHRLAERREQLQGAGVVVAEGEVLDRREDPRHVFALAAQVKNLVVPLVPGLQEPLDLARGVPVRHLDAHGRIAHGDDARRHVREVEVELAILEAPLLPRDQGPQVLEDASWRLQGRPLVP